MKSPKKYECFDKIKQLIKFLDRKNTMLISWRLGITHWSSDSSHSCSSGCDLWLVWFFSQVLFTRSRSWKSTARPCKLMGETLVACVSNTPKILIPIDYAHSRRWIKRMGCAAQSLHRSWSWLIAAFLYLCESISPSGGCGCVTSLLVCAPLFALAPVSSELLKIMNACPPARLGNTPISLCLAYGAHYSTWADVDGWSIFRVKLILLASRIWANFFLAYRINESAFKLWLRKWKKLTCSILV